MFGTYFRTAVRALRTTFAASLINVVGLSIALAACVVVYLFLQVYYALDTSHEHGDRLYMVERVVERGGAAQTWGTTPAPLGPALAADLPQVERAVRLAWAGADVRTAEAAFTERVLFADGGFFEAFTFPLQAGAAALADVGAVVLSADAAARFFGDDDAVGRTLRLAFGDGDTRTATVAAVAAPFPDTASLRFDLLLGFDARPGAPAAAEAPDWATADVATFLLLRTPGDLDAVAAQMAPYVAQHRDAQQRATAQLGASAEPDLVRYAFENLVRPAPGAYTVIQRPTEAPHPAFSLILIALAGFMLALACFNYVNIALGAAARRLKEIGVRKVLGGTRRQLVAQFMAENLLLCALALGLGLGIAWLWLIPLFNQLFVLDVGLAFAGNLPLWGFLGALLLGVAVLSGAYPALYVAGFRPVAILRGTERLREPRWLTSTLLTAQFVIAFLAVLFSVFLVMNGRYLLAQAWGYDHEHAVVVPLTEAGQYARLADAARQLAHVRAVAAAEDHVGAGVRRATYALPGADVDYEALTYAVGAGYAEALGLRMVRGRFFEADRATDAADAVVVNERLAAEHGWAEPIGQTLLLDGRPHAVVGVVGDFLFDPVARVRPVVFRAGAGAPSYLVARVAPGAAEGVLARLEATWRRLVPDAPFAAFVQTEVFDAQHRSYANLARGFGILAALALLIACMGLFGLASQNAARRRKEVSVRKVLGATVAHVVVVVNRRYLVLLAVAAALATALTYGGLRLLLALDVANVMPLTPAPFVLGYLVVLLTVAVSVGAQSYRLATVNPAETLRAT